MPFPYDLPFEFDQAVVGTPRATLVRTGLMGSIKLTTMLPTAAITRVAMIGIVNQEETMAGVITKRHDLSGGLE